MEKIKFCYFCNAHYHHVKNSCVKCKRKDTHHTAVLLKILILLVIVVAELYLFEAINGHQ